MADLVESYLKKQFELNKTNPVWYTKMKKTCQTSAELDQVVELMAANITNNPHKNHSIHYSICNKNMATLIKNKCDPKLLSTMYDLQEIFPNAIDKSNTDIFSYCYQAMAKYYDWARKTIDNKSDIKLKKNCDFLTQIYRGCQKGMSLWDILILDVDQQDFMHMELKGANLDMLKCMMEHGYKCDEFTFGDFCRSDNLECIQYLISIGCEMGFEYPTNCIEDNSVKCFQYLVEHGYIAKDKPSKNQLLSLKRDLDSASAPEIVQLINDILKTPVPKQIANNLSAN